MILNNLAQWHLLYLSTALTIWRIIRLSQGAPAFQDRLKRSQKFPVFSPTVNPKTVAHRFSTPKYPSGIEIAFPSKTNTFPNCRKEVIPGDISHQENPLCTAEITLEDDYGMIDGVINSGHRGEALDKAQDGARRTTPEKNLPSGISWRTQNGSARNGRARTSLPLRNGRSQYNKLCKSCATPASRVSGRWWCPARTIFPAVPKSARIRVQNERKNACGGFSV